MKELIDKSALIAEIEKCYNECLKRAKIVDADYWNGHVDAYSYMLAILDDTLEVKEVDLEKEIDTLWCSLFTNNTMKRDPTNPHTFIPAPAYTKDGAKIAYTLEIDWKIDEIDIDADFLMKFARHFFELGLKTKKGE